MKYQKGQSGNPKGCPKDKANGGRRPDWLKEKCRDLIDRKKIIEFLADVAGGEDIDVSLDSSGHKIQVPADIRDRIKASEILLERGFGKPEQALAISGSLTKSPEEIAAEEKRFDRLYGYLGEIAKAAK